MNEDTKRAVREYYQKSVEYAKDGATAQMAIDMCRADAESLYRMPEHRDVHYYLHEAKKRRDEQLRHRVERAERFDEVRKAIWKMREDHIVGTDPIR